MITQTLSGEKSILAKNNEKYHYFYHFIKYKFLCEYFLQCWV
jgi:hypothetical protein